MKNIWKEMSRRNRCAILTIFFVGLFFTCIYIAAGVYPLGDRTLLKSDSLHQYLPFIAEFRDKLVNHEALLYSFRGGLGYNFWATFAYYLASPFNLLILLFPRENIMEAMVLIMFVKVCIAGGIFSRYLDRFNERKDYSPVIFGFVYSFNAFFVGYYFNLMWLDGIMMVPLIMEGIENIYEKRDGRLYCIALFYGIFCNYYVGYMLCLFSCIYFVYTLGRNWIKGKNFLINTVRRCLCFALYSVLAGGMSAIMLIPTYMSLQNTKAANFTSFHWFKVISDWLELLGRGFSSTKVVNYSYNQGEVNIYCGCILFILFGIFILDSGRGKREKIFDGVLLLFLFLSINSYGMNIVWNGFHIPNGLAGRYTFLYILFAMVVAYKGFQRIEEVKKPRMYLAVAVPIVFFALYCIVRVRDDKILKYAIVFLLLFTYGYLIIKINGGRKPKRRGVLLKCLCALMIMEAVGYSYVGFNVGGKGISRNKYAKDMIEFEEMKEYLPDSFFRADVDKQIISNEDILLGVNGLTLFSSTLGRDFNDFFSKTGVTSRTNKVLYIGVPKLFNDIFGIRYLISEESEEALYQMNRVMSTETLSLYENPSALSLGFMMKNDIKDWNIDKYDTYMSRQSSFTQAASGKTLNYIMRDAYSVSEGEDRQIELKLGQQTYLEINRNLEALTITTPQYEKTYKKYTKGIYNLGTVMGDENLAYISITCKDEDKAPLTAHVYTCTDESYSEVYDALSDEQMEVYRAEENVIEGSIDALEDGVLFISVPYDRGWSVKVDGSDVDALAIAGAFMGIPLTAGTHLIEMKYIPEGFIFGLWVSGISVLLTVGVFVMVYMRDKSLQKRNDGDTSLEELSAYAENMGAPELPGSGRQEYLERVVNQILYH